MARTASSSARGKVTPHRSNRRTAPAKGQHCAPKTTKNNHNAVNCSICHTAIGKYKCPKCRAPYCSVACCKSHKESCTCVTIENDPKSASAAPTAQIKSKYADHILPASEVAEKIKRRKALASRGAEEEEEDWRLTPNMLSRLDENDWLRNEVRSDGGLRQIIVDIDCASDREKALNEAKVKYPRFAEFVEKMLHCAGILVNDDDVYGGLRLVETQKQIRREARAMSYRNSAATSDDDDEEEEGSSEIDSENDNEISSSA
mmetsp:Transcript_32703/g.47323  ORF Transcript_32703/g.47323 Transcript_32703/m.47323 type:complete len:260 (-) Transcript_32703:357-1136(-)|eukprot:CAMPEP_0116017410 /NCGR_PEP_ID=MMETSP0321-20121206/8032_1 /TAXON_ID=163516 /ORGANISM="Leptocylindrus danicus var. danicus, Strain B650" /LENGTH=259 /DNA_ID=CAMNT_0003487599 /DNA_START=99 /DNA_END=878 /DNA_ORIENTATION=+